MIIVTKNFLHLLSFNLLYSLITFDPNKMYISKAIKTNMAPVNIKRVCIISYSEKPREFKYIFQIKKPVIKHIANKKGNNFIKFFKILLFKKTLRLI